jgi:HAD superfamily hydrolase (TIGR01490 family)
MNIAFFDVDETVIDCKSMFVFAKYYLDEDMKGRYGISFATLMEQIHRKVEDGASRETVNRFYYETFAGHSQRQVREAARALYAAQPYPLRPNTVERLREHQRAGDEVVFVSGAMVDIIYPLMEQLNVRSAHCSLPAIRDGRYTGELLSQAIGTGKAAAVERFCAIFSVAPERCSAYGDHVSDQHLLSAVGFGVAVNPDEAMTKLARNSGWEILA